MGTPGAWDTLEPGVPWSLRYPGALRYHRGLGYPGSLEYPRVLSIKLQDRANLLRL